ncbi:electron transfer flavoprotein subunit alpha/FixB family protein [Serinibacter arcticus]|uniref:electron transfer flavoprotein subunit alpha/FixB family protein n=1 Tax=Serinibacter arcticus TaxID=1655435 RepID=UPI001F2A7D40|nr:FAD-binding protein [Serinibacter arcticus]
MSPVRALADALGGAVGATRDIVEEGWIGHETMVGQTGTMIAPRLYVGAGISGAPHHRLGMQAAEVIVAINLDADAPIMEIADVAIVGDAAAVLTQVVDALAARRAH